MAHPLKSSIGSLIGQAARLMGNKLNRNFQARGFDITGEQWILLLTLFEREGQTQQELAGAAYKNKASITSLLDTMERKELIVRKSHDTDGRSNLVYLTGPARELQPLLVQVARETNAEVTAGLSTEQVQATSMVLQQIINNCLL